MQFGYEDRIAELRAQIDRISSRQLLDQELYEQKLEQILQRQATLESRASRSAACPTRPSTGSIKPAGKKGDAARTAPLKPAGDKGAFLLQSDAQPCSLDQLPARPANPPAASTTSSRACRLRSTGSNRARARRSVRSRKVSNTRRGASAACWSISDSKRARATRSRSRASADRSCRSSRPAKPAASTASFRASGSRAPMSSG